MPWWSSWTSWTSALTNRMTTVGALAVALPVLAALVVVRVLSHRSWGRCDNTAQQRGRVFVVTGANSGLGKETARLLAQRNARVVLACRDMAAAHLACEDIRRTTSLGELIPMQLDLASLESVYTFAQEVLQDFPQVHVLINNAGLSIPDEKQPKTEDGIEMHFGVNYLGHFFLTNLLLERIKESAPSRIVNVSSLLHQQGIIDFDHLSTGPLPTQVNSRLPPAYCNSKLCNVYHAMELGRKVADCDVDVYTLCPGWCYSGLMRNYSFPWYKYLTFIPIAFLFMRSASKGAQCIVHCAVEENLPKNYGSFGFYRNCKPFSSRIQFDPEVAQALWDYSDNLIRTQAPKVVQKALVG